MTTPDVWQKGSDAFPGANLNSATITEDRVLALRSVHCAIFGDPAHTRGNDYAVRTPWLDSEYRTIIGA